MSQFRNAGKEYLAIRRALGFKLNQEGRLLNGFADFAERERASFITRDLALQWAIQPAGCRPARWSRRLDVVRRFAEYRSAADSRTEVPPVGLLPHPYRRTSPYIYNEGSHQGWRSRILTPRSSGRFSATLRKLAASAHVPEMSAWRRSIPSFGMSL